MTEFVEEIATFAKACGGSVKVKIGPIPEFVMPREFFFKSLAAANAFAAILQREEAEAYITSLPKNGRSAL